MIVSQKQTVQNRTLTLFRNAHTDIPTVHVGEAVLDPFYQNLEGDSLTVEHWDFPEGKDSPRLVLTLRDGFQTFQVAAMYHGREVPVTPPKGKGWEWRYGQWEKRTGRGKETRNPELETL